MNASLRNSFFAFLTITAAVLVGRVLLSFALVTAGIAHTSYLTGAPMSVQQLASAVTGGIQDIADAISPPPARSRMISVLDPPEELEKLRKARDARLGGPLIIEVGR